jgi:hypothetical protein
MIYTEHVQTQCSSIKTYVYSYIYICTTKIVGYMYNIIWSRFSHLIEKLDGLWLRNTSEWKHTFDIIWWTNFTWFVSYTLFRDKKNPWDADIDGSKHCVIKQILVEITVTFPVKKD